MVHKFPDQLALPGLVWARGQVTELVERWFGIQLSRVTIGKYLRSWGLSPQKPIRAAYERYPEAAARWVEQDYPAISARSRKEQAMILWLDQTRLRSDAAVTATWAPGDHPGGPPHRCAVRRQRHVRDQQQGRAVLHRVHR
ncbi:winged helix-turn-helix domain-containing protein [Saccharopolyspora elongata]|uniref:Winged helix-turn-helix domain-containing protein n=1 Tax=Saccharopolyspora elongata TaxID=2530387 RepID=A0A4R4XWU4_9PSEU|nr:winged helix-turn-helix domain-containing protein [Saccharopolyspora elongata]TDD36025.1 winged helix-turn-helix domain-containing protein [Saccharopolyspora elongata]